MRSLAEASRSMRDLKANIERANSSMMSLKRAVEFMPPCDCGCSLVSDRPDNGLGGYEYEIQEEP